MIDEKRVKDFLLTGSLMLLVVVGSFLYLKTKQPLFMVAVIATPFLLMSVGSFETLIVIAFLAQRAKLMAPGIPASFTLTEILQVGIFALAIFRNSFRSGFKLVVNLPGRWLLLFVLNVFLVISVRGAGFRMLGGGTYGGMAYVHLLIPLAFYFVISSVRFQEKHIRQLFYYGLIAGIIPFVVQFFLVKSGGALYGLTKFVKVGAGYVAEAALGGDVSSARWTELSGLAGSLMLFGLVLPQFKERRQLLRYALLGAAILLTLMSGFRGRLISVGASIFFYLIYDAKDRKKMFWMLAGVGVLFWVFLIVFVTLLPPMFQRSVSILPFVDPQLDIQTQAAGSIDYRKEIWVYCAQNFSKYLLIGRGLTLEVAGVAWLQSSFYNTPEWRYIGHAYHSGPFSLLIDFGLVGFITATTFMLTVCTHGWKTLMRLKQRNDLLYRYFAYLVISFTYGIFSFYFIYGDIKFSLTAVVVKAGVLFAVGRVCEGMQEKDAAEIHMSTEI